MRKLLMGTACAVTLACGITGPSYPDVAGSYIGPLTVTSSLVSGTLTGTMSINVLQVDDQVTVTGSMTFMGSTNQLAAITGTINETGFFTGTAGGVAPSTSDPECGVMTTTASTLSFSGPGPTARFHQTISTTYCGGLSLDAELTRR